MKKNGEYTREQRLRAQQKINKQMQQLFNNKQKRKDNKKLYIENKRCEAAHQADLQHKQSQLLLLNQDRVSQAPHREAHLESWILDQMMEEYRHDLGEDYVPFINMIDINSNEQPSPSRPRPEQQQRTTLPHESERTAADIMADILLRKQQQPRLPLRTSSSHLDDRGEGGEDTSRRRVRTPSPTSTSAAAEQSLQTSETSLLTTTRRRHRPRTSIIVITFFSLLYFISVFTLKIDILLPSYLKSASESVHQLYGASEALSYLEYIEDLAQPAAYLLEYIMSRAASDSGDISGVMGGRPQPPSPPTSVHASTSPQPPSPMGPLDLLNKPDIIKSVAEFHIKRDASYIAPPSLENKDIYNMFNDTTWDTADLTLNDHIPRYFRSCPPSRSDRKIGYIVLTEPEYKHLWDHDRIKMTNVDIAMSQGYPNLYQHIHSHQQATDAINFKITSCILLGTNDKIDINWKEDCLGQRLFLVAVNIAVDEPRTRNILRRESSQHQEFELNQPISTPLLHVPSVCNVLVILIGPTGQYIFDKVNHPGIVASHVFDQTAISGPFNSHAHSLISLCARETIGSKAHRHIQMYFPHMLNIVKWQEEATSGTSRTIGKTSGSSTTLTTNIMHSKGAIITIKCNDGNSMDID